MNNKSELFKVFQKVNSLIKKGISPISPPGTGKTTGSSNNATELSREGKKVIFLSPRHDHLNEWREQLSKKKVDNRKWQGLKRICPKIKSDSFIKEMAEANIWANIICKEYCKEKNCPYRKQFINRPNLILAPHEYLYTKYIADFDHYFIDESLCGFKDMKWSFSPTDFYNYIKEIEEYNKKYDCKFDTGYLYDWLKIFKEYHTYLLNHLSILSELDINDVMDNFRSSEWLKDEKLIVAKAFNPKKKSRVIRHIGRILSIPSPEILVSIKKLWSGKYKKSRGFLGYQVKYLIEEAIKHKNITFLYNALQIQTYFDFFWSVYEGMGDVGICVKETLSEAKAGIPTSMPTEGINKDGKKFIQQDDKQIISDGFKIIIGMPYLFYAFDKIAQGKQVIFTDATFNYTLFNAIRQRWIGMILAKQTEMYKEALGVDYSQFDIDKVKNIKFDEILISNLDSKVFKVIPDNYTKSNWTQQTLNRLFDDNSKFVDDLHKIKTAQKDNKVGTISYDRYLPKIPIGKKFKFFGLSGSNLMEHENLLLVFSTPNVPPHTIPEMYVKLTGRYPSNLEPKEEKYFVGYNDKLLDAVYNVKVVGEQYNAIHRTRFLFHDKEVFVWGLVPDKIKKEVTYEERDHSTVVNYLTRKVDGWEKFTEEVDHVANFIAMCRQNGKSDDEIISLISLLWHFIWEDAKKAFRLAQKKIYDESEDI